MMRPGSDWPRRGVSSPHVEDAIGRSSFARPKSMTLARPVSVIMTFEGFKSRCTMPSAWACASPSATSRAMAKARPRGRASASQERGHRLATDELHGHEGDAIRLRDLVDHAQGGVNESGRRAGLLEQPVLRVAGRGPRSGAAP